LFNVGKQQERNDLCYIVSLLENVLSQLITGL